MFLKRFGMVRKKYVEITKLVCIGDSLTALYYNDTDGKNYCTEDRLWTSLVMQQTGINVINKGISGQRSSQILARFKTDVIDLKPSHCIIEEGANDPLNNVPASTTINNIDQMVQLCLQNNIVPLIMCSIPELESYQACVNWGTSSNLNFYWETTTGLPLMRSLEKQYCADNKIPYLDIYTPFLKTITSQNNDLYIYDRVHPNEFGNMQIASVVINALNAL